MSMIDNVKSHKAGARYVFINRNGTTNERARQIGWDIYDIGGDALMNELMVEVEARKKNGQSWICCDLRELECCWNGIGNWMS
jgi:hypothetical protein